MAASHAELKEIAKRVRKHIVTMVAEVASGHVGSSLSAVELGVALYFQEMNVDPKNISDPKRDRFLLSKGHASPFLYSVMAEKGYLPVEELTTFRKIDSHLQGHPAHHKLPGVEISGGSLGQGLSQAVGMALAGKLDKADYRVYCMIGDGEIQEGQIWEAMMFAGNRPLDNLCVILDNNGYQIDGPTNEINSIHPVDKKFEAFNFHVITIDGHDYDQIFAAFAEARATKGRPTVIIANTSKGKGVKEIENTGNAHSWYPKKEQLPAVYAEFEQA